MCLVVLYKQDFIWKMTGDRFLTCSLLYMCDYICQLVHGFINIQCVSTEYFSPAACCVNNNNMQLQTHQPMNTLKTKHSDSDHGCALAQLIIDHLTTKFGFQMGGFYTNQGENNPCIFMFRKLTDYQMRYVSYRNDRIIITLRPDGEFLLIDGNGLPAL